MTDQQKASKREYNRARYLANRDQVRAQQAAYVEANKTELYAKNRARNKAWYEQNREAYLAGRRAKYAIDKKRSELQPGWSTRYHRQRRAVDLDFRLRCNLRVRVSRLMKSGSAIKDLGCSVPEFRAYLASKFQPGMTWSNYGRQGWHVDHVRPLSMFDLTDREQLKQACHYTNMQPMWWRDNLSKGGKRRG
jgi:hypothetical protein